MQAHLGTGIHPGWYFQGDLFLAFNQPDTIAVSAGVFDHFPFTSTLWTGGTHSEKALGPDDLTPAIAGGTGYRLVSGTQPRSFTGPARIRPSYFDILRNTMHCFHK
jgi:hypothetical protein